MEICQIFSDVNFWLTVFFAILFVISEALGFTKNSRCKSILQLLGGIIARRSPYAQVLFSESENNNASQTSVIKDNNVRPTVTEEETQRPVRSQEV